MTPAQIWNRSIQEMDEDGTSVVFDLRDVVSDPEGVPLEMEIAGEKNGEQGPILFSIEGERITLTPLLNAHGATVLQILASDGENPSVLVEMAVVVNPVNDPVVVNASAWTNLSMVEDTPSPLRFLLCLRCGRRPLDVDTEYLMFFPFPWSTIV